MTAMSRVPEVIDALVEQVQSNVAEDVSVLDGPGLMDGALQKRVFIGWDGRETGEFRTLANWDVKKDYIGGDSEVFSVVCTAECWTGDIDIPKVRTDVFGLYDAIKAAIDEDSTLGLDDVVEVHVRQNQYWQFIDNNYGAAAKIIFEVDVEVL